MEQKKRNMFFFISAILTLVFTVYVLYMTVFDQIISQSQGYFYAGFFGFILLLVFLLCNLVAKLFATSESKQETLAWKIIGVLVLVIFCAIYIGSKFTLVSQLSATDSAVYNSAVSMMNGTFYENHDLVDKCLYNPAQYLYAVFLSVIFNVVGESSIAYIVVNSVLYAVCILLVYSITKKLTDRISGLIAALIYLIIPTHKFAVFNYDSNPLFSLIALLCFNLFITLFVTLKGYDSLSEFSQSADGYYSDDDEDSLRLKSILFTVLTTIFTGILIFIEPVMIISVVLIVVSAFCLKKNYAFNILIAFVASLLVFTGLSALKASHMEEDFGTVIGAEIGTFDFLFDNNSVSSIDFKDAFSNFNVALSVQDDTINNTFYFLYKPNGEAAYTDLSASWIILENQLMYMFLLIMLISCIIIAMKENMVNFTPICFMFIGAVILMLFEQNRELNKNYFISLLIISCGISVHYLYLNHHPEQLVVLNTIEALEKVKDTNPGKKRMIEATPTEMSEVDFVRRAKALVFIGNDDDLYNQIKLEEHRMAMKSGKLRDNGAFDDMDEEDFYDSEDEIVTPSKPSGFDEFAQTKRVPAYKSKPTVAIGDDNMYFDEEEAEAEQEQYNRENGEPTVKKINRDIEVVKPKVKQLPETEKKSSVAKSAKKDKTPKQEKNTKTEKKFDKKVKTNTSSSVGTINKGVAVRKIKNVDGSKAIATIETAAEDRYIPNPLPVPKKKEHKPIDYEVKPSSSGWDYDYDTDDNDDWDV